MWQMSSKIKGSWENNMNRLSEVKGELAAKLLSEVEFDQHIIGTRYHAMSGGTPIYITGLKEVAVFLHFGSPKSLLTLGGGGTINYIDFTNLRNWISDVFGDQELAKAIDREIETGTCFANTVGPIKQLLEERIAQCESVLKAGAVSQ